MSKDILITGGAGFIGRNLAEMVAYEGSQITILDNLSRGEMDDDLKNLLCKPNVNFKKCDLTNPDEVTNLGKFEEVYHLAAVQGTSTFYERPKHVIRTNILSTINILDWFVKSSSEKIIFSSSSETYAGTINTIGAPIPTPEDVLLSIEDIFNPRWSYAGSKICGELLFSAYGTDYDIDHNIIRYHNIYGPRMGTDHVIPEFILRALDNTDPFPIHGGDPTRAFCYVNDAVEATVLVMRADKPGEIFHIGNDEEEIKIRGLAEEILKILDHQPTLDIREAPEGSVIRRCPDITKLSDIGFKPETSLNEGLKKTIKWYRETYATH